VNGITSGELAEAGKRILFEERLGPVKIPGDRVDEPDAGTKAWFERHRWDASKVSRQGWATSVDGIMLSPGERRCKYATRCTVAQDDDLRYRCWPGKQCPVERARFTEFVAAARWEYKNALDWLDVATYSRLIDRLGILDLRSLRISARASSEPSVRTIKRKRPDGLYEILEAPPLTERYRTAVHREWSLILEKLTADA